VFTRDSFHSFHWLTHSKWLWEQSNRLHVSGISLPSWSTWFKTTKGTSEPKDQMAITDPPFPWRWWRNRIISHSLEWISRLVPLPLLFLYSSFTLPLLFLYPSFTLLFSWIYSGPESGRRMANTKAIPHSLTGVIDTHVSKKVNESQWKSSLMTRFVLRTTGSVTDLFRSGLIIVLPLMLSWIDRANCLVYIHSYSHSFIYSFSW